jgi:hypothetical protein
MVSSLARTHVTHSGASRDLASGKGVGRHELLLVALDLLADRVFAVLEHKRTAQQFLVLLPP